jgi:recombination protein RecT
MAKNQPAAPLTERLGNAAGATPAAIPTNAGVKSLLASPAIKKRFEELLNKRAPQYITSIVNLVNSTNDLQKVDQMSIISSCIVAATLDLPVDKNLGYAWIVPYKGVASFQLGYKGYIQLALRTGKYAAMNALEVYEGELVSWNRLTEKLTLDFEKKKSDAVVGYAGYFELVNGYRKTVYWTKDEIEAHRKRFSKSPFGWNNDYDAMALKTVIRNMLSKWGILSIEMQNAYIEESKESGETGPIDSGIIDITPDPSNAVDQQTGEIKDPEEVQFE